MHIIFFWFNSIVFVFSVCFSLFCLQFWHQVHFMVWRQQILQSKRDLQKREKGKKGQMKSVARIIMQIQKKICVICCIVIHEMRAKTVKNVSSLVLNNFACWCCGYGYCCSAFNFYFIFLLLLLLLRFSFSSFSSFSSSSSSFCLFYNLGVEQREEQHTFFLLFYFNDGRWKTVKIVLKYIYLLLLFFLFIQKSLETYRPKNA